MKMLYASFYSGSTQLARKSCSHRRNVRIRYLGDNPPAERGKKKPQRYRVPKGQPNFAYFAPGYDWRRIQDSPELPAILTEGEIKALCGCEHGLPVIGTIAGAIPDTIPRGAGLLVPPDEPAALAAALRSVIIDENQRRRLSEAASEAARTLPTWQNSAAILAATLDRLA